MPSDYIPNWSGSSSSSSIPERSRSIGKRPRGWGLRTRTDLLIQGFTVPFHADGQNNNREQYDLPELQEHLGKAVPFEENATDNPEEMGERQNFADELCPFRHAPEREHESGEEQRRE